MLDTNAQAVISFWFHELETKQWWIKDKSLDELITQRFEDIHASATAGELYTWRDTPEGRLAEIIVLDQFSRNIFRNTSRAFSYDGMALVLAQEAIHAGCDKALSPTHKAFLYLPFMHSESSLIHQRATELFNQPGLEDNYDFELKHKMIIDRFGRYPHRNKIFGRESSPEELVFLEEPGSSF
ncbi:DUF924 family protein [Pseudomonadota bacterium]